MSDATEAASLVEEIVPERLGKYEVVGRLGQGAMGVVYEAHDPFLDRSVAIKVMLPQTAADPEHKLRFEREARAVARLMHPNVVTVFDLGYHIDGSPYIAMELLRGHDLQETLQAEPPLPLERKVAISVQVLDGLSHAHAAGIVHRDVKPANVFLTDEGNAKIMDFGIARVERTASTTETGMVVGTPDYMSPEQVLCGPIDARSDLFSTGALLCEMVSGRRPFAADSMLSVLYKITHDDPQIELPSEPRYAALQPILKRALARDVEARFQTASEFAGALRRCLDTWASAQPEAPTPQGAAQAANLPAAAPVTISLDTKPLAPAPLPAPSPLPRARPNPAGLFAVLRDIAAGSKSGHLHFTDGQVRRSVRFSHGKVLYGTSDVLGEHLGDILVRYGRLTQQDVDRAVAVALAERRQVGNVLVEMGLLVEAQLSEAVGLHAREILFDATSREGRFTFEESGPDTLSGERVSSDLSTIELILEAARRVQDPGEVRAMLGNPDRTLLVSKDALNQFLRIQLTPADGFLLSRIDGRMTAREVFQLIPLPGEEVERSLFSLLSTGVVEYQTARPAPRATGATSPTATARSRAAQDLERQRKLDEERRAQERREEERVALEDARRTVIEMCQGLAAKDHFQLLGVPRNATLPQIQQAYSTLARLFDVSVPVDPGLADVWPMRVAVWVRLGEALQTLSDSHGRRGYEADLDRKTPGTSPVTREVDLDDEARKKVAAREKLAEAEAEFERGHYWDTIRHAQELMDLLATPDQIRARVLVARAQMQNPKWVKRAEESLLALLQDFPDAAEVYLALGEVYRAGALPSRAATMYRRALSQDPGNATARAALTALSQEGQAPDEAPSGGRFKRMFRKE